jgi:NADH:ubiquinone oxidoreductase subunit C
MIITTNNNKWGSFSFLAKKQSLFLLVASNFFSKITLNLSNVIFSINFIPKEIYFLYFVILKSASFYYYNFISDFTAVHFPNSFLELRLQCILRNFLENKTLIINIGLSRLVPIPSLSTIYKGINWLERETYDMFGVWFFNHLNLRRILTDYGFKGFPLLKDFPVFGFKELRYDLEQQQLIYTPVVLTQKWRNYLFLRQWN